MGSAVALPWALHISPPPTRPRRSPLRGSPACQTPPSTPGQPALTPERDSLGVVKVGWFGWTRSRKANPGGRVPRRQGSTVGQGGRVPCPQPWQRCRTGKAGAWGSGLMFRGRMGAGRQVRSFGSMAAQGTAPPYRTLVPAGVKHEAPRGHAAWARTILRLEQLSTTGRQRAAALACVGPISAPLPHVGDGSGGGWHVRGTEVYCLSVCGHHLMVRRECSVFRPCG